ncbi:hypothetical protein E2562_004864 [Oryza meyeriana var. granulata]|uniref:NB-ARC domain-containing protein n=1 Tax=Oryza meyeriana var. granulata TaxID=110450 RepID=A0A6G1C3W1_9ORYZ|nr:hypothetical protein E2562_004864 [Oryza meyeriana var. granulata]
MPNWEEWSFVEEEEEGDASAATKQQGLLPCLEELHLVDCPKLRVLPHQLGQQATSLKELVIIGASCLKTVEDLRFLSGSLSVYRCEDLEIVSNLPQVRELYVSRCPNLSRVEELGSLEQLWLDKDMQEISSLWVPQLQEQRHQLHGDELEVNEWLRSSNWMARGV